VSAVLTCVFCGSNGPFRTRSHIVPESLGGAFSPVSRGTITCDQCNQYFGQKVEASALASFPFSGFRFLSGVPSKKGRHPRLASSQGCVSSTGISRQVVLDPRSEEVREGILQGRITQLRLVAEASNALSVCRLLLKIGIEHLANSYADEARSQRLDDARAFARNPRRGSEWWFVLRVDPAASLSSGHHSFVGQVEIVERASVLLSLLQLPGIDVLTPLEPNTLPPRERELPEPEYRVCWARC
jgi:hypothetical protein